jgi:hypothetical protein
MHFLKKAPIIKLYSILCLFFSAGGFAKDDSENIENGMNKYPSATPSFLHRCNSELSQAHYQELLRNSDISTFSNYQQAAPRIERIAEIFSEAKDRRGIFSSMYVENTKEAVHSTLRGEYENTQKSAELIKRFAERYFEPLHAYLRNGAENSFEVHSILYQEKFPIGSEWRTYFQLAENCKTTDLRLLGTGINNHMSMDLAYALSEIHAPESFKGDFMKFGNILVNKKSAVADLLIAHHNVYAASFMNLFFVGNIINGFAPAGSATSWAFQLIRREAWHNGQTLQVKGLDQVAKLGIGAAWRSRQLLLSVVPHSNPEMKVREE